MQLYQQQGNHSCGKHFCLNKEAWTEVCIVAWWHNELGKSANHIFLGLMNLLNVWNMFWTGILKKNYAINNRKRFQYEFSHMHRVLPNMNSHTCTEFCPIKALQCKIVIFWQPTSSVWDRGSSKYILINNSFVYSVTKQVLTRMVAQAGSVHLHISWWQLHLIITELYIWKEYCIILTF